MLCLYTDTVSNENISENQELSLTSIQNTINIIHNLTKNVYKRIIQIQDNFQKIIVLSTQWKNKPMYLRENNTKLITFGHKLTEIKTTRYAELRDASVKIHTLLKENLLLFQNVPLVDPNLGKLILFFCGNIFLLQLQITST